MEDKILEGLLNNDKEIFNLYQTALHDAWNLINCIFNMSQETREEMFGTAHMDKILNMDVDDVIIKLFDEGIEGMENIKIVF